MKEFKKELIAIITIGVIILSTSLYYNNMDLAISATLSTVALVGIIYVASKSK